MWWWWWLSCFFSLFLSFLLLFHFISCVGVYNIICIEMRSFIPYIASLDIPYIFTDIHIHIYTMLKFMRHWNLCLWTCLFISICIDLDSIESEITTFEMFSFWFWFSLFLRQINKSQTWKYRLYIYMKKSKLFSLLYISNEMNVLQLWMENSNIEKKHAYFMLIVFFSLSLTIVMERKKKLRFFNKVNLFIRGIFFYLCVHK